MPTTTITLLARAVRTSDTVVDATLGAGFYPIAQTAGIPNTTFEVTAQVNVFNNTYLDPAESITLHIEESFDGGTTWQLYREATNVGGSTTRAGTVVGPGFNADENFSNRRYRGWLQILPRSDGGGVGSVDCSVTVAAVR